MGGHPMPVIVSDLPSQPAAQHATEEPLKDEVPGAELALRPGSGGILWIHLARITAVFSVVLLHSAAPLLYRRDELSSFDWAVSNVLDSAVRMSSPLLFMCSGYLLLGRDEPMSAFFRKRFFRVVVPLAVWTVAYLAWRDFYHNSRELTLSTFLDGLQSPVYYHLWFVFVIIGLYIATPFIRLMVAAGRQEILWFYVAVWFVVVSALPALAQAGVTIEIGVALISTHSGYYIFGYLLSTITVSRSTALLAIVVYLFSVSVTALGAAWIHPVGEAVFFEPIYLRTSPNVVAMAVAAIIVLRYVGEQLESSLSRRARSAVAVLASLMFGVYLAHVMVLEFLADGHLGFAVSGEMVSPVVGIPLTAIVAFVLSLAITVLLRALPGGRWAVS